MKRKIRTYLPYALMLLFAAWCAYKVRGDLAQLSVTPLLQAWDLVLLAVLLIGGTCALRIYRWRLYLARFGYHISYRFAALTFLAGLAYTLSPGRVGELVRLRYYVPLGIPKRHVTAAFFAERLMDVMAMLLLSALLFSESTTYRPATVFAGIVVLVALVALALVPWGRLEHKVRSIGRLPEKARRLMGGLLASLTLTRRLLRPQMLMTGFLLGMVAWGIEGAGIHLLGGMFPEHPMELPTVLGAFGVALIAGNLSFLPGGLGGTEAVMTVLLTRHGLPVSDALLVTLTWRLIALWLFVSIGWMAVLVLRREPGVAGAKAETSARAA